MTNDETIKLIKTQFETTMDRALKSALLSSPVAILEAPPLSILTNEIIDWAVKTIANDGEILAFINYINFNVNQEGHDFMNAAQENDRIQKSGSEDEKKLAIKNLENSFSKLIPVTT